MASTSTITDPEAVLWWSNFSNEAEVVLKIVWQNLGLREKLGEATQVISTIKRWNVGEQISSCKRLNEHLNVVTNNIEKYQYK